MKIILKRQAIMNSRVNRRLDKCKYITVCLVIWREMSYNIFREENKLVSAIQIEFIPEYINWFLQFENIMRELVGHTVEL